MICVTTPRRSPLVLLIPLVATSLLLTGCLSDDDDATPTVDADVVVDGLDGPTQLAVAPDGTWLIAQLAGGENDASGQIVSVDPARPEAEPQVLIEGLDKPTGVAVFDGRLWVIEHHQLTTGPLDGSNRTVVVSELASNGRSQGTLTVDGDRLLFNTSGRLASDGKPVEGSGLLWAVADDDTISPVADGFKHAYATVRADSGTLYSTEVSDGVFDGAAPPDELVAVVEGADHGWPRCIGDNVAVTEFGGDPASCAKAPPSTAVFEPRATPTGVAVAPWDPNLVLVALWNTGQVVAIDISVDEPAQQVIYEQAARPQHLVAIDDAVLLTEHQSGRVVRLTDPNRS